MNIIEKRATNPASALTGAELVYVAQLGADAVTTVQDIQYFATNGFLLITTAASTYVAKNAPITEATKTKITYNTDGLITSGADATTADIADSPDRRYITDAQQTVLNNTSNTNSGDETTTTIKTKLGTASTGADGYLTSTDWNTFNGKQAALVNGTNIKSVNGNSLLGSGDLVVGEQSVVLLEQDAFQTLSVGKRHYLPRITTPYTLNLNAPTGAAIGDWFILESRYANRQDGIGLPAFLLGINLKMASGEYAMGYGDIVSPDTIPLLDVHNGDTNSPNFTSGCSFRFTKVTATGWALQPTYGSVMPEIFQMKVSGTNFGGTIFVSTAVAGSYATVTLPNADVDLGQMVTSPDLRYIFVPDASAPTATVPASAVTALGRTIIEYSSGSLTTITVNAATATGKVAGDSVHVSILTFNSQALEGSGVTLLGDLLFSFAYQTKTLIFKGGTTWKVVG